MLRLRSLAPICNPQNHSDLYRLIFLIGKDFRLLNIHSRTFGSEPYLITIGNPATVATGIGFINRDGGMWVFREQEPDIELFGAIEFGKNQVPDRNPSAARTAI